MEDDTDRDPLHHVQSTRPNATNVTQDEDDTLITGQADISEEISPPDTVEQSDEYVYNLLLTPVMPMFSLNNLAEDVGLGPDFWNLDQGRDGTF